MKHVNSDNYIQEAVRTDAPVEPALQRLGDVKTLRLLHAVMGVATEAGELVDVMKKYIFYGKSIDTVNITEELGDVEWYIALACDVLSTTMDEVLTVNIEKLRKRYPEKFTESNAINRDTQRELKHIKKRDL